MIQIEDQRYQIALWFDEDRSGGGLKLQFDTLEALAQFDKRKSGRL